MTTRTVSNGADSYVSSKAPTSVFYTQPVLRVSAGPANAQYAFLYFVLPFTPGVTVQDAKLVLTQYGAHAGAKNLTTQRVSSAFVQSTLNWNNDPGVTGASTVVAKGATVDGETWEIDLTAQLQDVANGAAWYGVRVTLDVAAQIQFHSLQSSTVSARPQLQITWFEDPDQPDQLQPSGGRAVSLTNPTFSFHYHDPSGDEIQSVQIQVATTEALLNANTPDVWNSGAYAVSASSVDSAAAGMAALATATTYFWRIRVTDNTGMQSEWSLNESFQVIPKGVLTATVDGGTDMMSQIPEVAWAFTGTQVQYQVIVVDTDNKTDVKWDSGKFTSTDTSLALPIGVLLSDEDKFTFYIRVYDDVDRQAGPNDPVYVEVVIDSVVAYDAGTAPVDSLGGTSDAVFPAFHLNFYRSADPDWFLLQRRVSGTTAWFYGTELIDPDDVRDGVDPTLFRYEDTHAAMYQDFEWRILAMVAGKQSDTNPQTSGSIRRLTTMVMTPDRSKIVALANPDRSRTTGDDQQLVPVLAGPPVLFTQYIGGDQGHCSGILADNFLPGYTGKQMFEWFKWMRKNPGIRLLLYAADETIDVAIFNCEFDTLVDGEGLYYPVEFDWVAV